MTAQIRPNRMEVSDRFPMLGFSVRVDEPNVEAEVVLANDISLFGAENKDRRNANNFYTSREGGTLMVPRGDGVFVVAPEVLARFIGSDKLYFGLATGHANNGGLVVDALPREGSPYVSLRGFTGRTLRRSGWSRRRAVAPKLEWTGDAPRPGSESAAPPSAAPTRRNGANGIHRTNGANGTNHLAPGASPGPNGGVYDDGFGPMPSIPARASAHRGSAAMGVQPQRMGIMLSGGTTASDALNWIRRKIEQGVAAFGSDVSPPSLYRLGGNSGTFVSAWETVFGITSFIAPANAFLAALPGLARDTGVTLSIGPALDTPIFGAGVGVVFAPNGQVALFGAGEISVDFEGLSEFVTSLKAALQAKMKLGYNNGGIDGFASLAKVASINAGGEIVVGAELWLDGSGSGLGGAVSIGVGFALQLAAEQRRARLGTTAMAAQPSRVGIMLSSGTTASDALNWIRRKVEQAVNIVGSDVNPPYLYRLGGSSGTFISAWEAVFNLTSFFSPGNAFLAALPGLARDTGITLSIGPALDTPIFGAGVGVVFAPNGQVALFGAGEISVDFEGLSEFVTSLKAALQAKMKLGYNNGGIDGFASLAKVASINAGGEIVVGAELWLDGSGSGLGGAVSIGVGFALQLAAEQQRRARLGTAAMAARPSRVGIMLSSGTTASDALNWIRRKIEQGIAAVASDVSPPSLYRLGGNSGTFISAWEAVFNLTSFFSPGNAFLAALPGLARDTGVTLSIGPALDTPIFGAGVGVVFAPNGQVALFGAGEISVDFEGLSEFVTSLKAALQAKMKLGYNSGGIDGFASLAKVASINVGEEIVVGAEVWLDSSGSGLGGAVSIGVGFALQLAAEQQRRVRLGATAMAVPTSRLGMMLSSGTTARDALVWIMRKVEQAANIVGSDVSPPSLYRLGGNSGTFISAWETVFGITSFIAPGNAFLAALPSLARDMAVTLSIGPALDTPIFGAGVGVVFAPNGQVALFGAGEISVDFEGLSEFVTSLKAALQAKMKLGYNSGGIDGFASLAKVASVNVGEEIVVGAELWLDGSGSGLGGAVSIGVGFALQLAAEQQKRARLGATALAAPTPRVGIMLSSGTTASDALNWIRRKIEQGVAAFGSDVSPPSLYRLGGNSGTFVSAWETVFGLTSFIAPANRFLAALPGLARDTGITLSIGPALDTPIFGGGVGVVFAPNGQVALFGAGEISADFEGLSEFVSSLKVALQAKMKLGYNNGGIDGFASLAKVASVNVGEEIVVGAELWLDGSGSGLGGAVSIGVGFALQLAADRQNRARMTATAMSVPPQRMGIMLSSGTTASDALSWIMRKVEQAVAIAGSDANPPSILRLGAGSSTFVSAWQAVFGLTSLLSPTNAFFAALPGLAADTGVTLSIGPALDTPVFGGGVGVVFAPNGQVALFGGGEVSVDFEGLTQFVSSLKLALQAKMKLGYNSGGIDGFASLAKVASVNVGEEIVVGAELWLDGSGSGLGGAVSIGVGFALQLAADRRGRMMAMDEAGAAIVPPALPNDQRARATRIGGPFASRVHEALDLGLNPKALDALLDTLDPPATPQPLTGSPPAQTMVATPRRAARGAPARRARQMDVGSAATIAGTPVTMVAGNAGSISWNVPQWMGVKHPNGQPPAGEAAYQDGVVMLNEWPRIGGTAGVDDVYAWFRIRWQFNGTSLGHIQVEPSGSNDSLDWGLTVTGMIEDDARLYPRSADAAAPGPAQVPALRIVMNYVFGKTAADSHMATSRITLYADGTHQIEHGRPVPAQPREVAYAG